MRYYDITISVPATPSNLSPGPGGVSPQTPGSAGRVVVPQPFQWLYSNTSYTSHPNKSFNPNALDIELQVRNFSFGQPGAANSGSFVRIWGVSQDEINQSQDLNDLEIVIKAGMEKGLPLAKPDQNGVIAAGRIFQAFGNWQGVDKTLDLILYGPPIDARNFQFLWKKGQWLQDAIKTTLQTAMPDYQPTFAISANLIAQYDHPDTSSTFNDFSQMITRITNVPQYRNLPRLDGNQYDGVHLTMNSDPGKGPAGTPTAKSQTENKGVLVYDGTINYQDSTATNPKILQYEDFIGQPTWDKPQVLIFKTVMRADLKVGDYVRIPLIAGLFSIVTPASAFPGSSARDQMNFGNAVSYQIVEVNHYGRYRDPNADSWVTVFKAFFTKNPKAGLVGPI